MEKINVTCEAADLVDIEEMIEFQGDLKELTEENYLKLKKSILENGISFPFSLWKNGKKKMIIDAHQRTKTLKRMREEGYEIPLLPVSWVRAKDEREAAKKVLAATSQFGIITPDGLHGFMKQFELDMSFVKDSFHFNEINFNNFADAYFPVEKEVSFKVKQGSKELDESEFNEFNHTCPKCGFGFD